MPRTKATQVNMPTANPNLQPNSIEELQAAVSARRAENANMCIMEITKILEHYQMDLVGVPATSIENGVIKVSAGVQIIPKQLPT